MKKARRLLSELRQSAARESDWIKAADLSMDAVKAAASLVAGITPELAADPDLLLKLIQMQRFATSLLVRARRIKTAVASEDGIARLSSQGGFEADSDDEWTGEE